MRPGSASYEASGAAVHGKDRTPDAFTSSRSKADCASARIRQTGSRHSRSLDGDARRGKTVAEIPRTSGDGPHVSTSISKGLPRAAVARGSLAVVGTDQRLASKIIGVPRTRLRVDANGQALVAATRQQASRSARPPRRERSMRGSRRPAACAHVGRGRTTRRQWPTVQEPLPVPTTGRSSHSRSPPARRPTARTGRSSPGAGHSRTSTGARTAGSAPGSSTSPTGRARSRRWTPGPTGSMAAATTTCSGGSRTAEARIRASIDACRLTARRLRPEHLRRHRSTRATGRGWRRENAFRNAHRPRRASSLRLLRDPAPRPARPWRSTARRGAPDRASQPDVRTPRHGPADDYEPDRAFEDAGTRTKRQQNASAASDRGRQEVPTFT